MSVRILWLVVVLTVPIATSEAQRGRAPCDSPGVPSDREDCLRASIDSADATLRRATGRVLELLPDSARRPFLQTSSKWIDYRRGECRSLYASFTGGTIAAPAYAECVVRLASDRMRFLSEAYSFDLQDRDARGDCLSYEPDTSSLSGALERRTYPGPPNYESVARGDEAETGFYLSLRRGICVTRNLDEMNEPTAGVRRVQLVLDQRGYERLRPHLGKHVTVRGTLRHSHTGHHHAELLLTVVK